MIYIISITLIILFIDIYIKLIQLNRLRDFTAFQTDILNKILVNKKLITREDIEDSTKELLKKMPVKNIKRLRKNLFKLGVDLNLNNLL